MGWCALIIGAGLPGVEHRIEAVKRPALVSLSGGGTLGKKNIPDGP